MKLYKVILKNSSCHGGDFDWTKHLPKKNGAPGKWTPRIKDVSECDYGYHVTPYWNMWHKDACEVYECETKGLVKKEDAVGVIDKFVCESVRLIKKVDLNFDGDSNTGNWNTGDSNTGNWNTGNWNTGDSNTGNSNTGNWNTGNWNTGNSNTGYRNTGYRNTGDWNTGYRNTGAFNTGRPQYYELFDRPVKAEIYEAIKWPSWFYFDLIDGDYGASWRAAFEGASNKEVKAATELPNFDYDVFEEITTITKAMFRAKLEGGAK
ncbi:MAG: pentapeptide repeat-containing protein [Verrucomicrobiota bacterium]